MKVAHWDSHTVLFYYMIFFNDTFYRKINQNSNLSNMKWSMNLFKIKANIYIHSYIKAISQYII